MADAVEGIGDEFRFAQQMKDTCCDESDKETKPAKEPKIYIKLDWFIAFCFLAFCNFSVSQF